MSTRKEFLTSLVSRQARNYIDPISLVSKMEDGEELLEVQLDSKYRLQLGVDEASLGCVGLKPATSTEELFSSVMLVCHMVFPDFSLAQVPVTSRGGLAFLDGSGATIDFHRKDKQSTALDAVNFFFSLNMFLLSRFAFCEAIRRGQSGFPRGVEKTTLGDLGSVIQCLGNSTLPRMLARLDSCALLPYCKIFG